MDPRCRAPCVPADATGIDAATLSILAWGVNDIEGEVDIIYVNGMQLGTLRVLQRRAGPAGPA